jgi:hypothetical protein
LIALTFEAVGRLQRLHWAGADKLADADHPLQRRAEESTINGGLTMKRPLAWRRGTHLMQRSPELLTEHEVARSWSLIFKNNELDLADFDRAEQMLEELRPESPLRLRLTVELEELRNIHADRLSVAAQP